MNKDAIKGYIIHAATLLNAESRKTLVHGIHISCPHCRGALPPVEGLVYVPDPGGIPQ